MFFAFSSTGFMESLPEVHMTLAGGVLAVFLNGCLSSYYLKRFCATSTPGFWRLLVACPTILFNFLIPVMFDERIVKQSSEMWGAILSIYTSFLVAWLSNQKIIAYCLNRGILVSAENWDYWRFTGVVLCPINPKTDCRNDTGQSMLDTYTKSKEIGRWLTQCVFKNVMLLFMGVVIVKDPGFPLTELGYGFGLMFWLGCCFDFMQAFALLVFDIDSIDSFDHPYLSIDNCELWSKRWNTMTAKVLKPLSYDLVKDGVLVNDPDSAKPKRPEWRRGAAVLSIFLLSGFMHCMCFWYVTRQWVWKWFMFFSSFGPVVLLEQIVKKFVHNNMGVKSIPLALGIFYTLSTHVILARFFFVPPAEEVGLLRLIKVPVRMVFGEDFV
ncbi:hypothetical protein BSKO_06315 [Bryopsis sp. KO-2023]|nr:hypothetical protein BSKO_06315 [Bryopsis sp. KO-2023]